MLLRQNICVLLLIILLKDIKSEETASEATSTTIKKDIDSKSLNLEDFSTTPINPRISLSLENALSFDNLPSISNNPEDSLSLSTSTTDTTPNDFKDIETTASWELIYPEQNLSNSESSSSSAPLTSTTTSTTSTSTSLTPTEISTTNLRKYFKVDDVTNCQKYFGTCLKQVLSIVMPKLKDGVQFLHMPSLDPIHFNSTAFQYNSGPFSGYITIRYALIHGLTSMKFKKIDFYKLDSNKFKARLSMYVPKMCAVGSYKGDMHVNNVRVRPRGDFNVTMTGLGIEMVALGAVVRQDDHMFLSLTKSNATTTLKDSKITATGIFPDQRLNDIVLNVANQYWRDLFNIVLPETRQNWLPILTDALNGALAMVPFDFLK